MKWKELAKKYKKELESAALLIAEAGKLRDCMYANFDIDCVRWLYKNGFDLVNGERIK